MSSAFWRITAAFGLAACFFPQPVLADTSTVGDAALAAVTTELTGQLMESMRLTIALMRRECGVSDRTVAKNCLTGLFNDTDREIMPENTAAGGLDICVAQMTPPAKADIYVESVMKTGRLTDDQLTAILSKIKKSFEDVKVACSKTSDNTAAPAQQPNP